MSNVFKYVTLLNNPTKFKAQPPNWDHIETISSTLLFRS